MKDIQPTDIVKLTRSAADYSLEVSVVAEVASVDAQGLFDKEDNFYDFGVWNVELVEARAPRTAQPGTSDFI